MAANLEALAALCTFSKNTEKPMAMSIDNLRKGKKYRLFNYGEEFDFQVIDMPGEGAFLLKDLHTLEKYTLFELLKYGKGKDFDLNEL